MIMDPLPGFYVEMWKRYALLWLFVRAGVR